jgi:hypothetical protein
VLCVYVCAMCILTALISQLCVCVEFKREEKTELVSYFFFEAFLFL